MPVSSDYTAQLNLLKRYLRRTTWAVTKTVGPDAEVYDYTSISAALAAIIGFGDAAADNRYCIQVADGVYAENAGLDFTVTGGRYIDLVGSGPYDGANGVKITCTGAGVDTVKCGGCYNMIEGILLDQNSSSGNAYALHIDSAPLGSTPTVGFFNNCKFTANRKSGVGFGIGPNQLYYLIGCDGTSTYASTSHGLFGHTGNSAKDLTGKLAVFGGTWTGPNATASAGIRVSSLGCFGTPIVLLSNVTMVAQCAGSADLIYAFNSPYPYGSATVPADTGGAGGTARTWTQINKQISAQQGVFNGAPWWYNGGIGSDNGNYTMYYSSAAHRWIIYKSLSVTGDASLPRAKSPDVFESTHKANYPYWYFAATDTSEHAVYQRDDDLPWVAVNGTSSLDGVTDYISLGTLYMRSNRGSGSVNGIADELQLVLDSYCTFTNAGAQGTLATIKPYGYCSPERVSTEINLPLRALGWLGVEVASIFPAAADVRDGTSVGDGATNGTLDLPAEADVKDAVTFDGATKTGTYPTTEDSQAAQLATDTAAVEADKDKILPNADNIKNHFGVEGTLEQSGGGGDASGIIVVGDD